MKTISLLLAILLAHNISAQSVYITPSIGAYLNADIHQPLDLIGYEIEAGYCFDNEMCVGASYGTLDLANKAPFVQIRTGYTFIEKKRFSLSIGAGIGYVFNYNQLIGEGDLVANIHLKPNWDFTVAFANQGIFKTGYLPAINVGFVKYFDVDKKKKK